jgi:uncharacterized membrane protein YhaH (DUF805 family)
MNWYLTVLKKYATFSGRARRKEYWMFVLFNLIISFVLGIIDGIISGGDLEKTGIIGNVYSLALLVPSIAVAVRRMHDVGKSGWFILIPIYNFILTVTEGDSGSNEYGNDPKSEGNDINNDDTLDSHMV